MVASQARRSAARRSSSTSGSPASPASGPSPARARCSGTLAYMAPEQADGQRPGPAADVYSLAITLYECFCGEHPLVRENAAATARAIGEEIVPLGFVRPDLPPQLADVIDSCLDPDPELRPLASELEAVLMAHARELTDVALPSVLRPEEIDPGSPAARPHPPACRESQRRSRSGALVFAAMALASRHHRPWLRPSGGPPRRGPRPRSPQGRLRGRSGRHGRVARLRRGSPGRRAGRRRALRSPRPASDAGGSRRRPPGRRAATGPDRDRPRLPGARRDERGDRCARPARRPRLRVARRVGGRIRHDPRPRPRDRGSRGLERVGGLGAGRRASSRCCDPGVLLVACVWAGAAALLPLLVRGRSPVLDMTGALIWAAGPDLGQPPRRGCRGRPGRGARRAPDRGARGRVPGRVRGATPEARLGGARAARGRGESRRDRLGFPPCPAVRAERAEVRPRALSPGQPRRPSSAFYATLKHA